MEDSFARALRNHLRDNTHPYKRRIKLCKQIFKVKGISHSVIVNRVQLEWVVASLSSLQSQDISENNTCKLWKVFHVLLQSFSKQDDHLLNIRHSLPGNFLKVLADSIDHFTNLSEALQLQIAKCCKIVLQNQNLLEPLLLDFESYILLLSSVINALSSFNKCAVFDDLRDILDVLLSQCKNAHRSQVDQEKVFEVCIEHLLEPVAKLLNSHNLENENSKTNESLKSALGNLLFSRGLMEKHFNTMLLTALDESFPAECPQFLRNFLVILQTSTVCITFPLLLEEFLIRYKNSESREKFHFFALFVRLIGIDATCPEKTYFKNREFFNATFSETEDTFSLLAELLSIVSRNPNVCSFKENASIVPMEWFQDLMSFLLNKIQNRCASWFKCLQALLVIDNKIITSNLQVICKVAWLSLDRIGTDVQEAQSDFFCQVFATYARLQQLTALVDKIIRLLRLEAASAFIKHPHFPSGVLEKFSGFCVNLSSGQALHLWKNLTSYIYSYYIPKSAPSLGGDVSINRLLVLPVIECLSAFLLNTPFVEFKLANVVSELCNESVNTAIACLVPLILESLHSKDALLLRHSLMLSHSWGEAHLVLLNYNAAYARQWASRVNTSISHAKLFFDLTNLHFYLDAKNWNRVYKACAEWGEWPSFYAFAQLIVQKIKCLTESDTEHDGNSRKSATAFLLSLVEVEDETMQWDREISSLCKSNFQVAIWSLLCNNATLLVPNLSSDDVITISRLMVATFDSNDPGIYNQNYVTRSLIRSNHFHEMIVLQSALSLVSFEAILTETKVKPRKVKDSKVLLESVNILRILCSTPEVWLQYANSTPSSTSDGLNPLWNLSRSAAVSLSKALQFAVEEHDVTHSLKHLPLNQILKRLMFINEMPMEFFVPGNQIHCLFGLFAVLLPIVDCKDSNDIHVECIIRCLKSVIAVLDGMRSVWLLDLIPATDLLLWIFGPLGNFQTRLLISDSVDVQLRSEFCEANARFLEAIMSLVKGNSDAFKELDSFIDKVESLYNWQSVTLNCENLPTISSAVIMMQLFHKMMHLSDQSGGNTNLLTTCCNYMARISKSLILWFSKLADSPLDRSHPEKELVIVPILKGFNMILEFQMNTSDDMIKYHSQSFKHWKKLVPEMKALAMEVSSISKDFTYLESSCQLMYNLSKYRENLKKYISSDVFQETWNISESYLRSSLSLVQNAGTSAPLANDKLKRGTAFIRQLVDISTAKEFSWILKSLLNNLVSHEIQYSDIERLKAFLHIWHILVSTFMNCERKIILEKQSQRFLIASQNILQQISLQAVPSWEIAAFILEIEAILIKNTKMTSGRVALCLHGVTLVDTLLINNPDVYRNCFHSIHLLLNNILISKKKILSEMMPPFLSAVQDLLHSVIQKGQQHLLKDAPEDVVMQICGCAQKLERLFAQISSAPLDFTKVASYLVASFVTESCSVTLYPAVKKYLTEGIYSILNICDQHAVISLQASLNETARQVFNSLYTTYMHYYQYRGKV